MNLSSILNLGAFNIRIPSLSSGGLPGIIFGRGGGFFGCSALFLELVPAKRSCDSRPCLGAVEARRIRGTRRAGQVGVSIGIGAMVWVGIVLMKAAAGTGAGLFGPVQQLREGKAGAVLAVVVVAVEVENALPGLGESPLRRLASSVAISTRRGDSFYFIFSFFRIDFRFFC